MKSHITVLLDKTINKIDEQLRESLEPHRLDEDDIESIQGHHWDYWYFPIKGHLSDIELKANFPSEPEEVLKNSGFVKNLPESYSTSGVILKDGTWIDLQDFGWRLIDEPSESNNMAFEKWNFKLKKILSEYNDDIFVQVIMHC
jgi:hypothetical protein